MDFTSDITSEHSSVSDGGINAGLDQSSELDSVLMDENEKKFLKLQEEKDLLLKRRDSLINEVDTLKRKLEETPDLVEEPNIASGVDQNAANILIDLMLLSSSKSSPIFDEESVDKIRSINGNSSLQEELKMKFDTLPLLNMKLRLRYLQKLLYPNLQLRVTRDKDGSTREIEVVVVDCQFKKFNKNAPIKLNFEMQYDSKQEKLLDFKIMDVSNNVKLELSSAIRKYKENPTILLFYFTEYDRILYMRQKLIEEIIKKHSIYIKDVIDAIDYTNGKITLKLSSQNELHIIFEITSEDGYIIPKLRIKFEIFKKNGQKVVNPNVNDIFNSLIKEYGLIKSIHEIIRLVVGY
ncbi:hypothetical protein KAFR_0D01100 [Kazachstania africana CBS 2517]|uniref:Uncharacterized protein n=1 Tax=Kazachstania africana (strain ATCC 22294 / BCRC 22015 / CBS 2517 / CECT 1963 / NBRC 1671 / NRRL Y-8276) TaxID=1071382 RepID=H2ATQ6_KAZAF|nr:hypothetical protein KAFR_0D01100 [Kazachstania africana CBS 2517]CCF57756.1 hypothetical protein KAFR_0D01100 [Kazachstania africana CBS 2517]